MSDHDRTDHGGPTDWPPVSVFLAVRDEEGSLADSLERLLAQDYPGALEIVVAVGPSSDATHAIAEEVASRNPSVTVVDNPAGTTPHGLNAAVAAAAHDIVVRLDGHAFAPSDYVRRVVHLLEETGAANVGGRMAPTGTGPVSRAVAVAMSSRWGIGGGAFHVGGTPGPQPTVYLGAFRRAALHDVGGYDERFLRAQDWELNHRLREAGHTVWFDPSLAVEYHPRASWSALARQQFRTGGWRRRVIESHPGTASARYLAPPVLAAGLAACIALALVSIVTWGPLVWAAAVPLAYLVGVTAAGLVEGRRERWSIRARVPLAMAVMHLAWGAGFLLKAR